MTWRKLRNNMETSKNFGHNFALDWKKQPCGVAFVRGR